MKVRTSTTLSEDVFKAMSRVERRGRKGGQPFKNRSAFVEAALWAFIRQSLRTERKTRDVERINQRSAALNREAIEVLAYQGPL